MTSARAIETTRDRHYGQRRKHVFKTGDRVYSKRLGRVGGFEGKIVGARGSGFQVESDTSGNIYQRDHYDLILIEAASNRAN